MTEANIQWVHYKREQLEAKSVKGLKKILDDHKINYSDVHEKEELVDIVLDEGSKRKIETGHSYPEKYHPVEGSTENK